MTISFALRLLLFLIASSLLTLTVTSCKRYLCTSSKSWFEDLFLYYYKVKCVLNIQDLFWGGKNGLSWCVICLFCEHPKMTIYNLYSELLDRGGKMEGLFLCLLTWILTLALFWILISASTPPCSMIWLDSVKCIVNLLKCAIWITFWFHWYMTANLSFPNHFFQIKSNVFIKPLFFYYFFYIRS